jgi:phospholipase/carboxylesterase
VASVSSDELLPRVEIEPSATGEPAAVVWLHGLGADGHDFEPIVPYLGVPWARFVFPHAPSRPVTINGGYVMPAWFDITGLGRGGANLEHVAQTRRQVTALLDREIERGVPSRRVVLAGFSQGGGVALYTGLRHPRPLGGILVASGFELLPETLGAEVAAENLGTPILLCHGLYDDLVPVARGREAFEARRAEGRPVEWRDFPIGHEVSMEEIETFGAWLRQRLTR